EFDFRAGGKWSFIMHGPAGNNFKNESLFVEIIKPEKIVIDHLSKPQFRLTATFTPVGDKTKLTFVQLFESEAMRDIIKIYAAPGNEENFDKLEALLAKLD
ncbi:MAG: SRPBCC domain-containing protein, partial [Bdellovibrionales bacterium]